MESIKSRNRKGIILEVKADAVPLNIPKSFLDILGQGQAGVEIEGLKRDVMTLANNRFQDAINRKIAGNNELVRENMLLRSTMGNMQQMNHDLLRRIDLTKLENNRLKVLLENSKITMTDGQDSDKKQNM